MIAGSRADDEAGEFLTDWVARYNDGITTRDFSAFLATLTDDAVFEFEGMPDRGPLTGKAAIAQHFADDPPDDRISVKRWRVREGTILAEFAWSDIPEGGGCLILQQREGLIAHLTIALGGPRCRFR